MGRTFAVGNALNAHTALLVTSIHAIGFDGDPVALQRTKAG